MSTNVNPSAHWNARELELIILDYFDMLKKELLGQTFNKAEHNRQLQHLIGRSRGAIEKKHQNISAVLDRLGFPWIFGYKPLRNYQIALLEAIESALPKLTRNITSDRENSYRLREIPELFIEAPPSLISDQNQEPQELLRLARKFDPALRDEKNRALGAFGEEIVFEAEKTRLRRASQEKLANSVRWISKEEGDGLGYDILSFDEDGNERFLEVKTTAGYQKTPFFISRNELALSDAEPERFRLVRLYDVRRTPRAFLIEPPIENSVLLTAQNFKAEFGSLA